MRKISRSPPPTRERSGRRRSRGGPCVDCSRRGAIAPPLARQAGSPTVRTTLPVFCPVSTYLVASTTPRAGSGGRSPRGTPPPRSAPSGGGRPPSGTAPSRASPSCRRSTGEEHQERDVPHEPEVGLDECPARLQRVPAAPERVLADRVEDDVVRLAVLREVFAAGSRSPRRRRASARARRSSCCTPR